jgi:SAM-dependent methyltransferase
MMIKLQIARALRKASNILDPDTDIRNSAPRTCPICGYVGPFLPYGSRWVSHDSKCRNCRSLDRHRLFKILLDRPDLADLGRVLHFAPEPAVTRFLRGKCREYITADYLRDDVDVQLDIEAMDLDGDSVDHIVCSHVLEHVDDRKALSEMHRVLVPGGAAFLAVPLSEGLESTYEDPSKTSERERQLHFGQGNHLRLYGRDFRHRIAQAGLALEEFTVSGEDSVRYGITYGERIFIARKPLAGT